jgi:hypothetical protein
MTQAEVRNLLGRPPGKYTDRAIVSGMSASRRGLFLSGRMESEWIGDEGMIFITWTNETPDRAWRVVEKRFRALRPLSFDQRCARVFPWW